MKKKNKNRLIFFLLLSVVIAGDSQSAPSHKKKRTHKTSRSPHVKDTLPELSTPGRSTEWQHLPKQQWERFHFPLPHSVDPDGFDNRSKITFNKKNKTFTPSAFPASKPVQYLAQIIGAKTEATYLTLNDMVLIHAEAPIELNSTYTITHKPHLLKSRKSDRVGYAYPNLGEVKILGVLDQLYVGVITVSRDFIARGDSLMITPQKITQLIPTPGSKPLTGTVFIDHRSSTYTTAQSKEVFIDLGSDDGITLGMIFRIYDYNDPSTDKKFTSADFIINGTLLVTQVSSTFCSALVTTSQNPIIENASAVLVTDLTDLEKNMGFTTNNPAKNELDLLDRSNHKKHLTAEDTKTLQQLETWTVNPSPSPSLDNSLPLPTLLNQPTTSPSSNIPDTPPVVSEASPSPSAELLINDELQLREPAAYTLQTPAPTIPTPTPVTTPTATPTITTTPTTPLSLPSLTAEPAPEASLEPLPQL